MASSLHNSPPAAPPAPPAPTPVQMPPWLLLSRIHVDADVAEDDPFLLTPLAPPRVSTITLSRRLFSGDTAWPPYIVAGDNVGRRLLVLTSSPGSPSRLAALHPEEGALGLPSSSTSRSDLSSSPPPPAADASSSSSLASRAPPDPPCFELVLCDLHTSGAFSIRTDGVHAPGAYKAGIISAPGAENFVLAELHCNATLPSSDATCSLRRYWSSTGRWTTTGLAHPQPARQLFDDVLAHRGMLWWVDLASGLYSLNPLIDEPMLQFSPLPTGYAIDEDCPCFLKKYRCLSVSDGSLRFAVIGQDAVRLWTLHNTSSGINWSYDYAFPSADLWSHPTYVASGLLESNQSIFVMHPLEPHLLYFIVGNCIVGINVRDKIVTEWMLDPLASASIFAWTLVPSPRLVGITEQNLLNLFRNNLQRLLDVVQDGQNAYAVGLRLSNFAARLNQLDNGLTEPFELFSEALPYLEQLGSYLGDSPAAVVFQQSVVFLQALSQRMGESRTAISLTSRALSELGLRLQRRHPNAQIGSWPVTSLRFHDIITVRNVDEATAVINEWRRTNVLVEVDVHPDVGSEEAWLIYQAFEVASAFDLITGASVLRGKIQDSHDIDWVIV